jgi:hypothetical protein
LRSILIACLLVAWSREARGDLSQYGSLSRQQTVARNLRQQEQADARREYRLWREEVRRQSYYEPPYYRYERVAIPVRVVR